MQDEYTRSKSHPFAFLLAAMLAGGLAGGGITYAMLQNQAVTLPPARVVTLQVATTDPLAIPVSELTGIQAVVHTAAPSVVEVSTESKATHPFWGSYITGGAGSGVILTEDGYIITNKHVIDGATSITVRSYDGMQYPASVIGSDSQSDLAVLKVTATGLTPTVFGISTRPR